MWSKESPKEPGIYWQRSGGITELIELSLNPDGVTASVKHLQSHKHTGRELGNPDTEWYSVPVKEPK